MKRTHDYNIRELSDKAYQASSIGEGRGGLGCVCECNRAFHTETLHPLVSLIDMSSPCESGRVKTGCYAVVFRREAGGAAEYGRRDCDFTDGTLLFTTPDKEINLYTADGKMLIFHPSLTRCTPLGQRLSGYSFFKYRQDEALHVSCCERRVIERCLDGIEDELCRGVDDYTQDIISNAIDLLLGYCRRFYRRQFITRHEANADAIASLDAAIDRYLRSGLAADKGLPSTDYLAQRLDMSACYLDDMLKNETGKTAAQYLQLRRMGLAKRLLLGTGMTVGGIASLLGFAAEGCFAAVFRKAVGCTPEEYRQA